MVLVHRDDLTQRETERRGGKPGRTFQTSVQFQPFQQSSSWSGCRHPRSLFCGGPAMEERNQRSKISLENVLGDSIKYEQLYPSYGIESQLFGSLASSLLARMLGVLEDHFLLLLLKMHFPKPFPLTKIVHRLVQRYRRCRGIFDPLLLFSSTALRAFPTESCRKRAASDFAALFPVPAILLGSGETQPSTEKRLTLC